MPPKISSNWLDEDEDAFAEQLTRFVIPDGEGFTALPIAFINVIASDVSNGRLLLEDSQ